MKKYIWRIACFICMISTILTGCTAKKSVTATAETQKIEAVEQIRFSEFESENFTCTGLTWDDSDQTFWIADYGTQTMGENLSPRLVEIDKELNRIISHIDLSTVLDQEDNLQGIAYCNRTDSFWIAVGSTVKNVNKKGELIDEISLGTNARCKANGICLDENEDSVWVLCYDRYLFNYSMDGKLLYKIKANWCDQDQIAMYDGLIWATVGADYKGTENYVISINPDDGETTVRYQLIGANSVEGIMIKDGTMYIANDGLYHQDLLGESYISIFTVK